MFCPNCGTQLPDGSKFCESCGVQILPPGAAAGASAGAAAEQQIPLQKPSPNIELCPDGTYRWVYEFHMLKNPVILFTVCKIFAIIIAGIFLFILILGGGLPSDAEEWKDLLVPMALFFVFFMALIGVSYLILASMYGWKYIVLFEMNDEGIRHIQQPKQFTKAQGIAWLTAMAGVLTGNVGRVGQGMLVASKTESLTSFDRVKGIKVLRSLDTIKVNELLEHNQVYAEPEDFDFVLNYIEQRIPSTAKRG